MGGNMIEIIMSPLLCLEEFILKKPRENNF
jgi:hypothetical protein